MIVVVVDDDELADEDACALATSTMNEQVAVFPAMSVAVYVTVVFPIGNTELKL